MFHLAKLLNSGYVNTINFSNPLPFRKDAMVKMFEKFDVDRSHGVSFDEAKVILGEFGFSDQEIRDMIAIHDTNKDGLLQYEEFIHFWNACVGKVPDNKWLSLLVIRAMI